MSLLDITAIGLQIILPLSLIAWLAFAPMKNRLGFSSTRFQPASSSPVFSWTPKWGYEMSAAENTPSAARIHQNILPLSAKSLLMKG